MTNPRPTAAKGGKERTIKMAVPLAGVQFYHSVKDRLNCTTKRGIIDNSIAPIVVTSIRVPFNPTRNMERIRTALGEK